MNCVLEHLAGKKPKKALVITDGYTGDLKKDILKKFSRAQKFL